SGRSGPRGASPGGASERQPATALHPRTTTKTRRRRKMIGKLWQQGRRLAQAAGLAFALTASGTAAAQSSQQEPLVFGGSIPLTGVFAFAGIHIHAGLT